MGITLGNGLLASLLANHVYNVERPDATEALLAKIEELSKGKPLRGRWRNTSGTWIFLRAGGSDSFQQALSHSYLNHLYEEAGEISFVGVDPRTAADPNAPEARVLRWGESTFLC